MQFCLDLHFGLQQEVVISKTSLYGSEWMFRHALPVIELLHVVLKCIGRILSCYGFPLAVRSVIIFWKIFLLFLRRQCQCLHASLLQYLILPLFFSDFWRRISPRGQYTRLRSASRTNTFLSLARLCLSSVVMRATSLCREHRHS